MEGVPMPTVSIPARKPLHATHRVEFDGAVDADGHILEPPNLWEEYIDPKLRKTLGDRSDIERTRSIKSGPG